MMYFSRIRTISLAARDFHAGCHHHQFCERAKERTFPSFTPGILLVSLEVALLILPKTQTFWQTQTLESSLTAPGQATRLPTVTQRRRVLQAQWRADVRTGTISRARSE